MSSTALTVGTQSPSGSPLLDAVATEVHFLHPPGVMGHSQTATCHLHYDSGWSALDHGWRFVIQQAGKAFLQGIILLPKFNYMSLTLIHVTQNLSPRVFEKLV